MFDGRTAENFKLVTGTWVQVNALRLAVIDALRPAVLDVAVAGHNRDEVGVLMFMNPAGCAEICGVESLDLNELIDNPRLKEHLAAGLAQVGKGGGSSGRVARGLILMAPPSQEDGEMTDKGYLNQRAVLRKRAAEGQALFGAADNKNLVLAELSLQH